MTLPLVIKFGGDALATPERIAGAARRIAERSSQQPVAAVASARRGVTDHLISLVARVRAEVRPASASTTRAGTASDRAVASGELVAASLLAVALDELGLEAVVLDAREAGLGSDGRPGDSRLASVRPEKILRLLGRGIIPVVTGFQGWYRGRITTLGRGGSDVTAVALAAALGAERCELVKDVGGLYTADPRVVPEAAPIARASHRFVTELAAAGARVIHILAAAQAEREGLRLHLTSPEPDGEPATMVGGGVLEGSALALAHGSGRRDFPAPVSDADGLATVTLVSADFEVPPSIRAAATAAAAHSGIAVTGTSQGPHSLRFIVAVDDALSLLRHLHSKVACARSLTDVNADNSPSDRRNHVGHR